MAKIDDLINKIEDPQLRQHIAQEVARMQQKREFGLVFEEHAAECTPLFDVPVRRGATVALKTDKEMVDQMVVTKIEDGTAYCKREEDDDATIIAHRVEDLVVVAQFGEAIYPYLEPIDSVCNAPDSDLWHTLIQADNYHALQLLEYLYAEQVDCIYIDPPYNTGARDWKYNNNYVSDTDTYRHSKWLSMMEKRLALAKKLLNPKDSVLIVTIDEKEYLHLGCLLEKMFPKANIQMVTSVISGKGVSREGQFSRVEEYIYFITLGNKPVLLLDKNMLNDTENDLNKKKNAVDFLGFRRRNKGNFRTSRPHQFYPIIVDNTTGHIVEIGDAVDAGIDRKDIPVPEGCTALWPLDPQGNEKIWSLVPESARVLLKKGFIKVANWKNEECVGSVKYLAAGQVDDIDNGVIIIDKRDDMGNVVSGHYANDSDDTLRPRRVWFDKTHNASSFGTLMLKKILGEKRFDFPKSLYAVHDALKFFFANNPNALILDFFAGSGTTLHAINLLNKEDGGSRRCIMVTNNEIGEAKETELASIGINPGDKEWEKWGIAQYVNWPRTKCSIIGEDVNGNPIQGEYITSQTETKTSERHFVQINYLASNATLKQKKALVALINKQKSAKLPTMKEDAPYLLSDEADYNASILFDIDCVEDWMDALEGNDHITELYIAAERDADFKRIKTDVSELMGLIEESVPVKMPMSDGFAANAAFFKLGFLNETNVKVGREFAKMLPMLWMKAGAHGVCPMQSSEDVPDILVLPENKMAILCDEIYYDDFAQQVNAAEGIDTVFLVTDSEPTFKRMAKKLRAERTFQLYRDYLDNFRINQQK